MKPSHVDALRFLWWPNGEIDQEPVVHRLLVHILAAKSSPTCANFALKQTAAEFGHCVLCKKRNSSLNKQFIADLPPCRLQANEPPFHNVEMDYFGPFLIKQKRSLVKRYGCLFSCLSMRAVHTQIANSLTADSFINALRRFIARRGSLVRKCVYGAENIYFFHAYSDVQYSLKFSARVVLTPKFRSIDVIMTSFLQKFASFYLSCDFYLFDCCAACGWSRCVKLLSSYK